MSEFSAAIPSLESARSRAQLESSERLAFYKRLTAISGDYSGSPLEDYLAGDDVESCRDFLRYTERREFPKSIEISMKYPHFGEYAWKTPEKFSHFWFNHGNSHTVWKGLGYAIGRVAIGIADCDIVLSPARSGGGPQLGAIRCWRNHHSFISSRGLGYGLIPNPPDLKVPINLLSLTETLSKYAR